MSAVDMLLSRLARVRKSKPNSWMACCPAHEDRSPSLAVTYIEDGRILIHCFAGCEAGDVLAAVGLNIRDLFHERLPGENYPQRKFGISGYDLMQAMRREMHVVAEITHALSKGSVDEELRARAEVAADRIRTAISLCDG